MCYCVELLIKHNKNVSNKNGFECCCFSLLKCDNVGNKLWEKTIGTSGVQVGNSVTQTSDGGFILTGLSSNRIGSNELYLVKTDASDNVLWDKYYSEGYPSIGYCVRQTIDGGYIAVGETFTQGLYINGNLAQWGPVRAYLVKTDAMGNKQWEKTIGEAGRNIGYSVEQTDYGEYIITGTAAITDSYAIGHGTCVYLVKVNAYGEVLWEKTFGSLPNSGGVEGKSVKICADGGYIICGNNMYTGAAQQDIYLLKTDANGNFLWDNHFGGDNNDHGCGICLTADGGYVAVGTIFLYTSFNDVYLVKVDAVGNKLWEKEIGSQNLDDGFSIQQTRDGGYIVAGRTQFVNGGDYNVYLIKFKSDSSWVSNFSNLLMDSESYTLRLGDTHNTVITATYLDNNTYNVTSYANFQSSKPWVASVSNTGIVTGLSPGDTVITATYGSKSTEAKVTVQNTTGLLPGFDDWDTKTTNAPNKIWTVKFNMPINDSNLSDNIYITDENNKKISTNITTLADGKSVAITPVDKYTTGVEYRLYITKNICSTNGIILKNGIVMPFIVQ